MLEYILKGLSQGWNLQGGGFLPFYPLTLFTEPQTETILIYHKDPIFWSL